MSAELATEDASPRSAAIGRRGSLTRHIGLRNCSKMNGWVGEEYSAFRAAVLPADHRHGHG